MSATNWVCTPASVIATPNASAGMPPSSIRSAPTLRKDSTATMALERFHIDCNRNRFSTFALSHFWMENRIPLFLKML